MGLLPNERYEAFKWEVLADAAMEDWQGLWEPVAWARTVLRDLLEVDRIDAAERAMRDLFAAGLIFFVDQGSFPGQPWQDRILSSAAVDAAISSPAWRSMPLTEEISVWFAGTETGEAAVLGHWAEVKSSQPKSGGPHSR